MQSAVLCIVLADACTRDKFVSVRSVLVPDMLESILLHYLADQLWKWHGVHSEMMS